MTGVQTCALPISVNFQYDFYYATPFPGSDLWDIALEEKVVSLDNINWDIFTEGNIFFKSSHINPADFKKLKTVIHAYLLRNKIRKILFSTKIIHYLWLYTKTIFSRKTIGNILDSANLNINIFGDGTRIMSKFKENSISNWEFLKILLNPMGHFKGNKKINK